MLAIDLPDAQHLLFDSARIHSLDTMFFCSVYE